MANATNQYLTQRLSQPFPFIVSRSQIFGHNRVATHWTGDNSANWQFLQASVGQIMSLNMFGLPFVGADICGFGGNTTPELCARWYQLGGLYPFSRNHNVNDSISQEPYALGPKVLSAAQQSIQLRYSILKYYYSTFLRRRGIGTVFRPVFFEFFDDREVLRPTVLNGQFLIGNALMAAPALEKKVDSVRVYLPSDRWYDFHTGQTVHYHNIHEGIYYDAPAPLDGLAPLFLRGGHIIPVQNISNVQRTLDLGSSFRLVLGLKPNGESSYHASGFIAAVANYSDDYIVNDRCVSGNCIELITADYVNGSLTINFDKETNNTVIDPISVEGVDLLGIGCNSQTLSLRKAKAFHVRKEIYDIVQVSSIVKVDHKIRVTFSHAVEVQENSQIFVQISDGQC
eukprot:TRINITY_DN11441_c0_g1_i4.p1 TRINITY_DN11441_c0_g1~~TRINITY_DN11441_c0_g1_i4.p1  ORF type:complete len:398 (+),score=108.41 TRINITY_DN11441_c0_g1_i4:1034-2227(+)